MPFKGPHSLSERKEERERNVYGAILQINQIVVQVMSHSYSDFGRNTHQLSINFVLKLDVFYHFCMF